MPTEHTKQRLSEEGITKDGYCLWWIRDMARTAKYNKKGEYRKNTFNEAGFIYGSKGLQQFLRKKGGKVYRDDLAAVRPAMWIKYDGE